MGRSCMSLDELHLRRAGPLLYLCYPTVVSSHTCWAVLKFTSYESKSRLRPGSVLQLTYPVQVIFRCTFLSLRSHDGVRHASNEPDHELKGESRDFSGHGILIVVERSSADRNRTIRDGGFRHALRLYRDKGTNAVRLEASVLDGEMKK